MLCKGEEIYLDNCLKRKVINLFDLKKVSIPFFALISDMGGNVIVGIDSISITSFEKLFLSSNAYSELSPPDNDGLSSISSLAKFTESHTLIFLFFLVDTNEKLKRFFFFAFFF